jgi:hypothetical protein
MFKRFVEVLSISFVVLQSMYIKQVITTQVSYTKHVVKKTCTEVTYNDIISMSRVIMQLSSSQPAALKFFNLCIFEKFHCHVLKWFLTFLHYTWS